MTGIDPSLIQDDSCRTAYIQMIQRNNELREKGAHQTKIDGFYKRMIYNIIVYFEEREPYLKLSDMQGVLVPLIDELIDSEEKRRKVRTDFGIE